MAQAVRDSDPPRCTMEARVKIEVDNNGRSSGISQQTPEEDAAGVAGAGGNANAAVLPGEKRPASCSVDDNCRESLESEEGQWPSHGR